MALAEGSGEQLTIVKSRQSNQKLISERLRSSRSRASAWSGVCSSHQSSSKNYRSLDLGLIYEQYTFVKPRRNNVQMVAERERSRADSNKTEENIVGYVLKRRIVQSRSRCHQTCSSHVHAAHGSIGK